MKRILFLFIACALAIRPLAAQETETKKAEEDKGKFVLSGLFRSIAEYRDGYAKPLLKDVEVPASVLRSRVQFTAHYTKQLFETKLTIQDARAWGSNFSLREDNATNPTGDMYENPLMVYEGWAQYNITPQWNVRVGRQEISYDTGRILWHRPWRDQGVVHDAAMLRFQHQQTTFNLGFSKSSTYMMHTAGNWGGVPYINDFGYHKHLGVLYFSTPIVEGLRLSFTDLFITRQGSRSPQMVYGLNTAGLSLWLDKAGIIGELSYIHQMGNTENPTDASAREVEAMHLAAMLGYKNEKIRAQIGHERYSGQNPNESTKTTYEGIYWAPHLFNGWADNFLQIPNAGLINWNIELAYTLRKGTWLQATFLHFTAHQPISGIDTKTYGSEIDFQFFHTLGKGVNLRGGFSIFMPDQGLRRIKGIALDAPLRTPNTSWLMLTFAPTFLNL